MRDHGVDPFGAGHPLEALLQILPAVSTRPMVEMPTVISQNAQLPILNDQSSRPHTRGQT